MPVLGTTKPPTYHRIFARLLSWLPHLSIVNVLYLLRFGSAIFGLLTLCVAWRAARQSLGTRGGAAVTVLLATHPQFAIVSTSATPDAIVNFFGACMWWAAAVAMNHRHVAPLAVLWCAGIAAASADRMGLPLLALACVVSVGVLTPRLMGRLQQAFFGPLLTVAAAVVVGVVIWSISTSQNAFALLSVLLNDREPMNNPWTLDFFVRFTSVLHRGWWFTLGWGRYTAPSWWAVVTLVVTMVAVAGIIRRLRTPDARERKLLVFAVLGLAIQEAAVYWTYFAVGNGAQGRYLFPLLVPSLVLLWVGIEAWVPQPSRRYAAAALVLLFALLDAAMWILVAIPAYYASF